MQYNAPNVYAAFTPYLLSTAVRRSLLERDPVYMW